MMKNESKPIPGRGIARWPALTIHESQLQANECLMEGCSTIQTWALVRWCEAVAAAPEIELHEDAIASSGWWNDGRPYLCLEGPRRYVHSAIWGVRPDGSVIISDHFEHLQAIATPEISGSWKVSGQDDWLHPEQLAELARYARPVSTSREARPPAEKPCEALWVLGSKDPEMEAIADLLRQHGRRFVWGTVPAGTSWRPTIRPVRPGEAVQMDLPAWVDPILGVECAVNDLAAVFDHHDDRPEAFYPPERFWEASSLGQVWGWLHPHDRAGAPPPNRLKAIAALDHCKGAALQGRCPGVSAELAREVEMEQARAKFGPDLSPEAFRAIIEASIQVLQDAPPALELCGGGHVADLRDLDIDGPIVEATGERYPTAFQFGPTAACLAGRGYVVTIRRGCSDTDPEGVLALRVGGCGEGTAPGPEPIEHFLGGVGEQYGCHPAEAPRPNNLYGSPARGFAGGTLRQVG